MTSVILVSSPGVLHDSLQSMLRSLPEVEVIGSASGGLSASELLQKQDVNLVVIDANLPDEEVLMLLSLIKSNYQDVRSIVLTTTASQKTEFLSAGAGAVLPRSSSARRFTRTVSQVEI